MTFPVCGGKGKWYFLKKQVLCNKCYIKIHQKVSSRSNFTQFVKYFYVFHKIGIIFVQRNGKTKKTTI